MTFFKRISEFVPIITSQETQTENPSQPQTQPNANLGIASNVDSFEVASQNNLFMDPQFQPANVIDSDATVITHSIHRICSITFDQVKLRSETRFQS
ncbi:MAG TPA: hypothetical protein VLH08_21395 [Acidobacteriota bacterium]|nr:hypothetical protein [Acidobacteriota bacterium]